ncbi:uncharacterized protein FOMMEDRAFT_145857 [Fomitiporia mediterranea MF3/22]|uniref:uncharacterized protein n=1 Tax=Fomitiporia mediterranea (strain MF3/22) TaxID=694068 RepID=UPI0004408495|nr:uncharacterized protein FOMMEDRAFT_145857 [Fomitiporia mediterranea MF3/22]EJD03576.1 hypothetical protein FOMMEDRAFT_145857 [Fomitiporia mediterranea MF3/22]
MSKTTPSTSAQSLPRNLRSPPQKSRPGLVQNGSARSIPSSSSLPNGLKSKDNVLSLDPDELFEKHTVHEVKSILHRLRSDVDAKQEELRMMVGERYRDLLQASTSIIAMSHSSKRVLDTVTRMKQIVSSDLRAQASPSGAKKGSEVEDAQLKIFQCLAAHLKLLLDAPEHLWRLLERKRCLHAAWLFLLARVVYRSLVNEGEVEGQDWIQHGIHVKDQFPLVQRQWESVSQFRTQISHRATLSLREQSLEPRDLCGAVLSLHLLDSLPLSDALDVFLKQRSRMLQNLYVTIKESWGKDAKTSSAPARSVSRERIKNVWDAFRSILGAIVGTVGGARAVFREHVDGSPSMITQVLMFTQSDSPHPEESLPLELRLSSQALLSSLPNSNHFLALPVDIRSYRPFIDLESHSSTINTRALNAKLRTWFADATKHLHEAAGSWLSHLGTVKNVWELRSSALEWISASTDLLDGDDIKELRTLVDNLCGTRIQEIWKTALENLSSSFRNNLHSLVEAVQEEREDCHFELSPVEFLLSAPPTPSVTHASLNVPLAQSSFNRFKHGIQQRIDGMTPRIDTLLSDTESATVKLRDDLDRAFTDDQDDTFRTLYASDSEKAAGELVTSVEGLLGAETEDSGERKKRLYLLARIAQKLSISPLISYLRCSAAFSDECHARARRIYDVCVEKCATIAIASARDTFLGEPTAKSHTINHTPTLPSNTSPQLMNALLSLVESVEKFGHFKDDTQRSAVAKTILIRFVDVIAESLQQSKRQPDLQLIRDLDFLKAICDEWGTPLKKSASSLDRTIEKSYQALPSHIRESHLEIKTEMQRSISQSISNVRLLLSPLMAPLDVSSLKPSSSEADKRRPSTSSVGGEREMHPPLNLVKPSPRFGLIWVASAASQYQRAQTFLGQVLVHSVNIPDCSKISQHKNNSNYVNSGRIGTQLAVEPLHNIGNKIYEIYELLGDNPCWDGSVLIASFLVRSSVRATIVHKSLAIRIFINSAFSTGLIRRWRARWDGALLRLMARAGASSIGLRRVVLHQDLYRSGATGQVVSVNEHRHAGMKGGMRSRENDTATVLGVPVLLQVRTSDSNASTATMTRKGVTILTML